MKLTNAQVTRIAEALQLAHCFVSNNPAYEPQRGRIEALVDDILGVIGLRIFATKDRTDVLDISRWGKNVAR